MISSKIPSGVNARRRKNGDEVDTGVSVVCFAGEEGTMERGHREGEQAEGIPSHTWNAFLGRLGESSGQLEIPHNIFCAFSFKSFSC